MQRIRTEILPGVWLTALRTEKFKTAWLSVNLLTQLRRETAACTAVLPYVLRRGCTRLPDLEAIAAELDGLYGAHITPVVHKLGEIQAVGFEADFADDGALGEEIFPRLAADVADLLLHPNTRGGLLRPDIVDSERTQLIARIRAAVNNKRSYARERLYTHMCCCEDFAVPRLGEEADAERIHYRKLTMRYHDVLSTSPVEIFYCGSIDGKRVARILTDVLSTMPRGALDEDIGTDIRMNALEAEPRYVTETLPVAQGQLAVGYRLGACMTEPDIPALFVFNALYGGCVTSKLFLNVREKLSLCYYASSAYHRSKGIVTVSSGIECRDVETAKREILAQLASVQRGEFEEWEVEGARACLIASLESRGDSAGRMEENALGQAATGIRETADELIAALRAVTNERIAEAAQSMTLDTVYFLTGEDSKDE